MSTEKMDQYIDTLSTYQRHNFYCCFIGAITTLASDEAVNRAIEIAIQYIEKEAHRETGQVETVIS